MSIQVRREIDRLKQMILSLTAQVEQNVIDAVRALDRKDPALAAEVIARDTAIDEAEVALEDECLKIFALYQPVAVDLRYIIAVLKINNDLERIGDLAVNIADTATIWAKQDRIRLPEHIIDMAERTKRMLRDALDALVDLDDNLANSVLEADDEIDNRHAYTYQLVEQRIKEDPDSTSEVIRLLGISRNLERIADHATNIAEDVLYLINGEIVRHKTTVAK